jgi:hypothetical protein
MPRASSCAGQSWGPGRHNLNMCDLGSDHPGPRWAVGYQDALSGVIAACQKSGTYLRKRTDCPTAGCQTRGSYGASRAGAGNRRVPAGTSVRSAEAVHPVRGFESLPLRSAPRKSRAEHGFVSSSFRRASSSTYRSRPLEPASRRRRLVHRLAHREPPQPPRGRAMGTRAVRGLPARTRCCSWVGFESHRSRPRKPRTDGVSYAPRAGELLTPARGGP